MAKKVLIVEDDGNIAELLHLYLEKEGFETKVAKDGGKGVEYFRSFQPDLVLLVRSQLGARIKKLSSRYYPVIQVDRSYVDSRVQAR